MAQTISKGKLFSVYVEVDEERLKALKETPEILERAMQSGADYWHTKILPAHFKADAHAKYGYARRSSKYLKNRNKGSKPDLIFSGSLRRDLRARASYKSGRTGITLTMSARVLNFVPNMAENNPDLYVRHKGGRGYPNIKRELKAITDEEREAIAAVVKSELERAYAAQGESTT